MGRREYSRVDGENGVWWSRLEEWSIRIRIGGVDVENGV